MLRGIALLAFAAFAATPAFAQTKLDVTFFAGAGALPLYVAQDKRLFAREGLEVNLTATPSSGALIQGLVAGKFQIAQAGVDNFIAYDEGQGTAPVEKTPDFVVFLGGSSAELTLISVPAITSYADLKGKALSVDSVSTGFAFVLRKMLEKNGLGPADYSFVPVGSTEKRWESMKDGKSVAALLNAPFNTQAVAQGFRKLGEATDVLGAYQGSTQAADRGWLKANEKTVVGYIRANVAATQWVYDPVNRDEAAKILMTRLKGMDDAAAKGAVAGLVKGPAALAPKAEIDMAGMRTVIELRDQYGEPKKKMGPPEKYIDLSYYKKAMGN